MLYAGIDFGTSGCRLTLINQQQEPVFDYSVSYQTNQQQTPELWWQSLIRCFSHCPENLKQNIKALSLDGTSGTVLLCDKKGNPSSSVIMYHDLRAQGEAQQIKQCLPKENGGQGASGSLARLLWLLQNEPNANHHFAVHQADYILAKLCGEFGISDENNCLKLGYDVAAQSWPESLLEHLGEHRSLVPKVVPAGQIIGEIEAQIAKQLELPETIKCVSGTTDSIAAFIATGASQTGEAVTSLGSTLVLKQISENPIYEPSLGVYSHRLVINNKPLWLVGGASNSGGNVIRHYFNQDQICSMTEELIPEKSTGLNYYPLLEQGERFPQADVNKQPGLTPRPESDVVFFQGILEGIANIEKQGYETLAELGAGELQSVRSVGGGSVNKAWTQIRQQHLNVPMITPEYTEASYGAALLALRAK